MLKFKAAIFDVDDTILDNQHDEVGNSLHERSRLRAVHAVGLEENIDALKNVTAQESLDAFLTATEHSSIATIWNLLKQKGIVAGDVIEKNHEILCKILQLKNEFHETILLQEAEPVRGAVEFIESLAKSGMRDHLAIASSASRHEIDLFFGKVGLDVYFAPHRIKSKEDSKHTKPNPEVFNLAFATLGLNDADREATLVFEDDPRGIMAGIAAGLKVCAITTRFDKAYLQKLEIPPHFVIESYDEARVIVGL